MKVDELDYFAFSYLKMSLSDFYEYVKSAKNKVKGQLKIVNSDSTEVLKIKKNPIVTLQEYRPKSDLAYIYQYNNSWIVFISNTSDGWASLVWAISKNANVLSYSFKLDKGYYIENCINSFVFNNGIRVEERIVQGLVDNGKWVFYEEGPIQKFESPEFYKRRTIKKRINYDILWGYCKKIGINLGEDTFLYPKTKAVVFERSYG